MTGITFGRSGLSNVGVVLSFMDDYEALFVARAARFAHVVAHDCAALLEAARASPGAEIQGRIAEQLDIALAVEAQEGLEEIYVAIKLRQLMQETLPILLAALFPKNAFDDLQAATQIAGRATTNEEIAYRVLIET
jgi:hypothetical protein